MNIAKKTSHNSMDAKKFDLLYYKYSQPMLLYTLTYVNSKSDAEDIVQEVFYNFWKSEAWQKIPDDEVRHWLLRAVKNACINFWEKKDVLRSSAELHNITIEEEEYSEPNEQIFTQIRQDIENMPPQTRKIVKAVFYKKEKYQDVADHLGISINTVKTLLRRAISQLRERHAGNFNLFLYFLLK